MQQQKKPADNHEANNRNQASRDIDNMTNDDFLAVFGAKNSEPNISASDTAGTDAEIGISQDFDLRKAVIYSEILKPKFDEE